MLKTDKSGKLCVATREEYVKIGQKHASKDRIIYRREVQEIEKNVNGHSIALTKIWDTGGGHGQQGRVIDAKVTHSENVSTIYVAYKDHKKEPGNTRGLSNSVSNFLESVANCIENRFECISSEDMLWNSSTKRC